MFQLVSVIYALFLLVNVALCFQSNNLHNDNSYYIAASVQYSYSIDNYTVPVTDSGIYLEIVAQNLNNYEPLILSAKSQGAQVIIFPEGGLGTEIAYNHQTEFYFCVQLEDVYSSMMPNICNELQFNPPDINSTLYQLYKGSCYAENYNIILVYDLCSYQLCNNHSDSVDCPTSGRFLFNTLVVFNETGNLIVKYHKTHLSLPGEDNIFDPSPPIATSFTSSFGVTFGIFICHDINYIHPALDLIASGVKDILFSSEWINDPPRENALILQQSWSRIHQVNLIASNIAISSYGSGGGIYSQGDALITLFEPNIQNTNQVLVAKVPILKKDPFSNINKSNSYFNLLDKSKLVEPVKVLYPNMNYSICLGGANCSIFEVQDIIDSPDYTAGAVFVIPISFYDKLNCIVSLSFGPIINPTDQYAIAIVDVYDLKPNDPYPTQTCGLIHCSKVFSNCIVSDENIAFGRYETTFNYFNIQVIGVSPKAIPLPKLSVDNGQVLYNARETTEIIDTTVSSIRIIEWSSYDTLFNNQSIWAAGVEAIIPPS